MGVLCIVWGFAKAYIYLYFTHTICLISTELWIDIHFLWLVGHCSKNSKHFRSWPWLSKITFYWQKIFTTQMFNTNILFKPYCAKNKYKIIVLKIIFANWPWQLNLWPWPYFYSKITHERLWKKQNMWLDTCTTVIILFAIESVN